MLAGMDAIVHMVMKLIMAELLVKNDTYNMGKRLCYTLNEEMSYLKKDFYLYMHKFFAIFYAIIQLLMS